MSEELKQAAASSPSEPVVEEVVPENESIGLSEEDLSDLGDLSVLQNQGIDLSDEFKDPDGSGSAASALEVELSQNAKSNGDPGGGERAAGTGSIQAVDFQQLKPAGSSGEADLSSIEMLMDVPLKISVELGRTRMMVREVLDLQAGSVVELDRMAGDLVDVYINERLIAKGEVVVVDDKFGVRITEMLGGFARGKSNS